ncbi:MAG: HAD family hydrolase [Pseudomonadota bacterium]
MRFDAILFDKDGTLFDFQATWTAPFLTLLETVAPGALFARAAKVLGYDVAQQRFRADSLVIASTTGEVAWALAPVVGREPMEIIETLDRIGSTARQVPAVPLVPCLSELRGFGPLGLVTNDSEAPARAHLQEAGVLDLFDFVAGYDSGFGAKPGPGQLLAFAEAQGLSPERIVMVGDSRHDLMAARAAGMPSVGVLTGVAGERDLEDLADVVLPDIGHLAAWMTRVA